jgi:hypothetical protein
MKKFNLSEAAKQILVGEGAKETFDSNISSKAGGKDSPQKLNVSVGYGMKDAGDINTQVTKTTDAGPNPTKGAPTATPPGATPPVGSEPMKKLSAQPAQSGTVEQPEGKTGKNQMPLNKGSVGVQTYEEAESEGDVFAEEKDEGHEDEAEDKKEELDEMEFSNAGSDDPGRLFARK